MRDGWQAGKDDRPRAFQYKGVALKGALTRDPLKTSSPPSCGKPTGIVETCTRGSSQPALRDLRMQNEVQHGG